MEKSSKSYAEIATPNRSKSIVVMDNWPDLNSQPKNKINQQGSDRSAHQPDPVLNTLTNVMERLSTDEVVQSNGEIEVQKSREVIRAERQQRRKNAKLKRNEQKLQEKISQIREPKSQKVQVVDKMVMERYLTSQQLSPIKDRRQSKFKNHSVVKVDLLDLINTTVVKPIDSASIHSNKQTVKFTNCTQRHKGKKSEVVKKKYVSRLKRSILLSRLQRNQIKTIVESVSATNGDDDVVSHSIDTKFDPHEPDVPKELPPTELPRTELPRTELPRTELPPTELPSGVKFSRKFRPYCDNKTTPELLTLTEALLRDIFRFQDRAYNKNEIKARSQRRYVVGFKEAMRQLDIGKIKLLIIAPDLEIGGTTEVSEEMKMKCQKADIPYVFSLKRRQLGYVLLKKVPVSCVGILNYQGSEENSRQLLQMIQEQKLRFQSAVAGSDNK